MKNSSTEPTVSGTLPWCAAHETHSGAVVLLGDLALKVKKPIALGFLDFTTTELRRAACEREVSLNRRLAPDVYLGVGELTVPGREPEPAVVMRRLPDERRLTRLVLDGEDVADDVRRVARLVATFHAAAPTGPDIARDGTRDALRRRWDDNLERARAAASPDLTDAVLEEVATLVHRFLDGRQDLFEDRIERGAVVDGHGDLTPDDIFCLPDGPRLLDCLEFDDRLRHVDRLDDIAFLAMGLDELGATQAARLLVETWAECTGDPAPECLLHHYIAYRAFLRAEVGSLAGAQRTGVGGVAPYVATALAHLRAGAVKLVLVGGPPASGKSTLAAAIADRLGMVVLSSDRLRKELAGLDPRSHAPAGYGAGLYSPERTSATYAELLARAEGLLRRGESVVLDASWTRADERRLAADLADRTSADLVQLRCEVDPATARARLLTRDSISDADEDVATRMRAAADPWPGSVVIDTSASLSACSAEAAGLVRPTPVGLTLRRSSNRPEGPCPEGTFASPRTAGIGVE